MFIMAKSYDVWIIIQESYSKKGQNKNLFYP